MNQSQMFFQNATDVQRRAVRVVRLFIRLANFVAVQQGLRRYDIHNMKLHEHFLEFVLALNLDLNTEERVMYHSLFGGKRRAVLYYEQAYGYTSTDGISAAVTTMMCSTVLSENFEREILEEARGIGVPEAVCNFDHLFMAANTLLRKVAA
jgi:hypothetical protein